MPISKSFLKILRDKLDTKDPVEIVNNLIERIRLGIYLKNHKGHNSYSDVLSPVDDIVYPLFEKELREVFVDGIDIKLIRISKDCVSIRVFW